MKENSKIAIIGGCGPLKSHLHLDMAIHAIEERGVTIVNIDSPPKEIPLDTLKDLREPEPYMITMLPRYDTFIPKAKHQPKGHQRPYKFHP